MSEDEIVREVRDVRERIAERFDFDLHHFFEDLRKRQHLVGARLVKQPGQSAGKRPDEFEQDSSTLHPGR